MRYLKQTFSTTVVVFTATEKQLDKLDVALGPCIAASCQRRPLKSPLAQDQGETPEQASALFTVLTGAQPIGALRLVSESGAGKLFVCTDEFLDAMAATSQAMRPLPLDDFTVEYERLASAWLKAVRWPDTYVSVRNRLHRLAEARVAREKGVPLYFWFGPSIAMRSVVAGSGPYPGRS